MTYPSIEKACLEITYDNGGIYSGRSERKWRSEYLRWIARRGEPLREIDAWLQQLSDADFETVCVGEHSEAEAIFADAPKFTQALLADFFWEVC